MEGSNASATASKFEIIASGICRSIGLVLCMYLGYHIDIIIQGFTLTLFSKAAYMA